MSLTGLTRYLRPREGVPNGVEASSGLPSPPALHRLYIASEQSQKHQCQFDGTCSILRVMEIHLTTCNITLDVAKLLGPRWILRRESKHHASCVSTAFRGKYPKCELDISGETFGNAHLVTDVHQSSTSKLILRGCVRVMCMFNIGAAPVSASVSAVSRPQARVPRMLRAPLCQIGTIPHGAVSAVGQLLRSVPTSHPMPSRRIYRR